MTEQTDTVTEVIDGRIGVYGDPVVTFPQIAQIWSGIIGHEITAAQVPLMLIGMKLLRTAQTPDYSDNSDDIEGYLDIFRKIVGEDMVQARSVTEYLSVKERRKLHQSADDQDQQVDDQGSHWMLEDTTGFYCSTCAWTSQEGSFVAARRVFLEDHSEMMAR